MRPGAETERDRKAGTESHAPRATAPPGETRGSGGGRTDRVGHGEAAVEAVAVARVPRVAETAVPESSHPQVRESNRDLATLLKLM